MRLAEFIRNNKTPILEKWQDFARELASAPDAMPTEELRDHAAGMLEFVTCVLESPSISAGEITDHLQPAPWDHDSAATQHGGQRMEWGFSVHDMVAEFRALRASVIHLWGEKVPRMNREDLIAFNEALDQALTESMDRFTSKKERQARLLDAMLSYSSDQSAIFDRDGTILYANRALARAYDKHPPDLVGQPVSTLDDDFAAEVTENIRRVWKDAHEVRGDVTVTTRNGEEHVMDFLFAPIIDRDGDVEAVAVHARDITERRQLERKLWRHANHDHLTGVPNRRLFMDRLEQDVLLTRRMGGILAVLFIDLDRFKAANDHLGHEGGDQLLRMAVERIQAHTRETDTVARLGGDEFTVILMGAGDRKHVEDIAANILEALNEPFRIGHESVNIGGSIGIAVFPGDAETVSELISRADQAMYVAKSAGGNQSHFHSAGDRRERAAPGAPGTSRTRH